MGNIMTDKAGNHLCNFKPRVEAMVEIFDCGREKPISHVKIYLDFEDGPPSSPFCIPMSNAEKIDWLNLDPRCRFFPDISEPTIKRYLLDEVRRQWNSAPKETVYRLNRIGLHTIGKERVFCTGREVIRPPAGAESRPKIEIQQIDDCLDIDHNMSEAEAIHELFDLMSLSPNPGRIILAQNLVYLMRQAYIDAGKAPCVCVFLYGKTGTRKTTLASILTQIFNRSRGIKNPTRLNASIPAAVKILHDAGEEVVVLDDLFPNDDKAACKHQEDVLIEITRCIGDGNLPARIKQGRIPKEPPTCGVLFTGEYIIGTGSDAARLLPVEMMQPDGQSLKYFQDRPLGLSTFYYFYIRWFIEKYTEVVDVLRKWLECYRNESFGVHARLQETHFFLNTAYALFLQYCYEKKFVSKQDVERLHPAFRDLLFMLIQEQDKRVQQKIPGQAETMDYLAQIRSMCFSGKLSIAGNPARFLEEHHDGVIHLKRLYLRKEGLSKVFPDKDIKEVVSSLIAQGVLETGKDNSTKQINRLKGKRFYVIPLSKLQ